MNELKIAELVVSIKKWHLQHNLNKNLNDFCKETNIELSKDEKLDLLIELAKSSDIFSSLFIIGNSLEEVANDDDKFIELLALIIVKIKNDLAQGPFVNPLISIGENKSELALKITGRMIEKGGDFLLYVPFLLGSSSKKYPEEIMKVTCRLLDSKFPSLKSAGILTIRIMYANQKINMKILKMLRRGSLDEDLSVLGQTLEAFLDFYNSNESYCNAQIIKIIKKHENFRYSVANRLWLKPLANSDNALKLLQICLRDKNKHVRSRVFYALTRLVEKFPEEIIKIIRDDLENGGNTYGDSEYLLQELGKANLQRSLDSIKNWIISKNQILRFQLPRTVSVLIPDTLREQLIPHIEKWLVEYPDELDLILKILNNVLSECYEKNSNPEFVKYSLELVMKLAKEHQLKPEKFIRGETNDILKCSNLIYALEYLRKNLDYDTILSNLEDFSNIKKLIGLDWIVKMKKENNKTHTLLLILSRKFPLLKKLVEILNDVESSQDEKEKKWHTFRFGNQVYDGLYLLNLDQNIRKLEDIGIDTIHHFRKKLKNEEQFSATVSEIVFIAQFVHRHDFTLEPQIGNKKMDAEIDIDSEKIIVEVISPNMFKPLNLLDGTFKQIPNRIRWKIMNEYDEQLHALSNSQYPVILVVDTQQSEIDYESVEDALFGDVEYNLQMDEKGNIGNISYTRKDNSVYDYNKDTNLISAVVCFKSKLYTDLKFHLEGKIIHNPKARTPLIDHLAKKIEEALFV